MITENRKFIFDSNIPFKKFKEFKKYKLNNNNNIKGDDRNNNYDKNSTIEEEEMNDYQKIKIKEKTKINEKEKLKENEEKIKNKEEEKLIEDKKNKLKEEEIKRKEEIENEKRIMSIFQPYEKGNIFSDYYKKLHNKEMDTTNKRRCRDFLKFVNKSKFSINFKKPVLKMIKEKEVCELYKKVIKKPMDLETLRKSLNKNIYKNVFSFLSDYSLIVTNAQLFNLNNSPIYNFAEKMKTYGRKYIEKIFNIDFNEERKKIILLSPKKDLIRRRKKNNNDLNLFLNDKRLRDENKENKKEKEFEIKKHNKKCKKEKEFEKKEHNEEYKVKENEKDIEYENKEYKKKEYEKDKEYKKEKEYKNKKEYKEKEKEKNNNDKIIYEKKNKEIIKEEEEEIKKDNISEKNTSIYTNDNQINKNKYDELDEKKEIIANYLSEIDEMGILKILTLLRYRDIIIPKKENDEEHNVIIDFEEVKYEDYNEIINICKEVYEEQKEEMNNNNNNDIC